MACRSYVGIHRVCAVIPYRIVSYRIVSYPVLVFVSGLGVRIRAYSYSYPLGMAPRFARRCGLEECYTWLIRLYLDNIYEFN